jgi:DNA-binding Lrp family transcriptional regulator
LRREDDLDVRLMRELLSPGSFRWDVRESYSSMAKRLGVDEETIRKRLKRAELGGILGGFYLVPNPHLFGMESTVVELDVDDEERKPLVTSQLKLVEGVVFILDFHGKRFRVVFYREGNQTASRRLDLIRSICGAKVDVHWDERFPVCGIRMKTTDWLVFKALRKQARRSLNEVADEIGVSTRTVKRRFELMRSQNAFFLVPLLAFERAAVVTASFTVRISGSRKRAIDEDIRSGLERVLFSNTSAEQYSVFTVLCDNFMAAEMTLKAIRKTPGVEEASMGINKQFIIVSDWIDEQVARHVDAVERPLAR